METLHTSPSPEVFDVARCTIHDGTVIQSQSPLRVVTPTALWAYALSFAPGPAVMAPGRPMTVRVRIRVLEGTVRVGCLTPDLSAFLVEAAVTTSRDVTVEDLPVANLARCGPVVVRNGNAQGHSVVEVLAITCHETALHDAFDVRDAMIHEGAARLWTIPLKVTTPRHQWAYGASIRPRAVTYPPSGSVGVRLRVRVTEGVVGIGCLEHGGARFFDEAIRSAGSDETVVELIIDDFARCDSLVVRNASAAGASTVELLSVACEELVDHLRGAILTPPAGVALRATPGWNRAYGTTGETMMEKARVRAYLALEASRPMSWIEGLKVMIHPEDQFSRAIYVSGLYEPHTMLVVRRLLRPGSVFLDIGANSGIYSLVASKWVGETGRVFSFEPSQREYERLCENIALNWLTNVRAIHAAVAERPGRLQLQVAAPPYGGLNTLSERFAYEGVGCLRVEEVECVSLDGFVEERGLATIDVIKMDIEGGELRALRGASRVLADVRPSVVFEVVASALNGSGGGKPDAIRELLADFSYALFVINPETAALEPLAALPPDASCDVLAVPTERVDAVLAGG